MILRGRPFYESGDSTSQKLLLCGICQTRTVTVGASIDFNRVAYRQPGPNANIEVEWNRGHRTLGVAWTCEPGWWSRSEENGANDTSFAPPT